jgi:ribosome-associated protein
MRKRPDPPPPADLAATDEPSRSALKREADAIFELARELVALTPTQLARVPLDEGLLAQIAQCHKVGSHIAHRRELMFLAKQLRKREDELPAIRAAVDVPKEERQRETAQLHRIERWRDRLIDEGDGALEALLGEYPGIDRQEMRQLIRAAREDRARPQSRGHYRALFQALKALESGDAAED